MLFNATSTIQDNRCHILKLTREKCSFCLACNYAQCSSIQHRTLHRCLREGVGCLNKSVARVTKNTIVHIQARWGRGGCSGRCCRRGNCRVTCGSVTSCSTSSARQHCSQCGRLLHFRPNIVFIRYNMNLTGQFYLGKT